MESVMLYFSGNAFGLIRVVYDPAWKARVLLNGETRHGMQGVDPARSGEPLAYYHRTGPLGDIFAAWKPPGDGDRVGIIGLGVGSIAAYARPGQQFTFFEIDPAVARIATDTRYFTFLSQCRGAYDIVMGDGRESLEKMDDAAFGMIILDAFFDAAIPSHLVSLDAIEMYLRKLTDQGLLVFHINTHGALLPELRRLASDKGLTSLFRADVHVSDAERADGKLASHYVVLTRDAACVAALTDDPRWTVV